MCIGGSQGAEGLFEAIRWHFQASRSATSEVLRVRELSATSGAAAAAAQRLGDQRREQGHRPPRELALRGRAAPSATCPFDLQVSIRSWLELLGRAWTALQSQPDAAAGEPMVMRQIVVNVPEQVLLAEKMDEADFARELEAEHG